MLYPSELRAHSRHYRRFLLSFMEHLAASSRVSLTIKAIPERQLHFRSPFLMFLSPLNLFTQATQQGDGWTLVKTIATTRKLYPTTL